MGRCCRTRQRFSLRPSRGHSSLQTLSEAGGGPDPPPDPAPSPSRAVSAPREAAGSFSTAAATPPLQQGPFCAAVHPLHPPPGSPGGQLVPLPALPSVTDGWKPSLHHLHSPPSSAHRSQSSSLVSGGKGAQGRHGQGSTALQPPPSSEGEKLSSFSAPTRPRAAVWTGPCSPHPTPQWSAIPDSRRGEGCYGSPNRNLSQLNPPSWSTSLPPLPAAAPGCSSPAKQSHRKQRQFNTGKCLEQGRLGETSLSSSEEESRGTLYFTVSIILGGSRLWFSIPGLPLGCHVPSSRH